MVISGSRFFDPLRWNDVLSTKLQYFLSFDTLRTALQPAPRADTFLEQQGNFVQRICTSLIRIDKIFFNITVYSFYSNI